MVLIPYAMDYTSTVRARTPKLVCCEKCSFEYVYIMERTGQGSGTSMLFLDNAGAQERAAAHAQNEVMMKLERSCDPVPCLSCGWYQQQMVERARYLRYKWMTATAIVLLIFTAFFFLIALAFTAIRRDDSSILPLVCIWTILAMSVLAMILCPILKSRWSQQYDPNAQDADVRIQLAQERAISKEDFLKIMQEQEAAEGSA